VDPFGAKRQLLVVRSRSSLTVIKLKIHLSQQI
jgi:hypothetical protein